MKKLFVILLLVASSAAAQTYPSKQFLVENRPGADSAIAAELVSKLPAEGYNLIKEINTALKRPEVIEKLLGYGYSPEGSTPERLLETNREDLALWRRLVREAGIPLE